MTYILLADGFEEIEALCPLDLLLRAEVEAKTVSVGKATKPPLRIISAAF